MKERAFRFSFVGVTTILFIIFGFWLFGGDTKLLFPKKLDIEIVEKILLPLLTSPILGLIISTLFLGIFQFVNNWLFDKRLEDSRPPSDIKQEYLKMIYFKFMYGSGVSSKDNFYSIDSFKTVSTNHIILFRENAKKEIIDFSLRRFDLFFALLNANFSILCGILVGLFLRISYDISVHNAIVHEIQCYKFIWILPILIFSFFSFYYAYKAKNEANDFEKRFLVYQYYSEKEKK